MITIPTLPNAELHVPTSMPGLVDMAHNLWWSWHAQGHDLWTAIDPEGWQRYHNPIEMLSTIDQSRWHAIEQLEHVQERYQAALRAFEKYMSEREPWFQRQGVDLPGPIAYLCTEFGVHASLPFYSGGLGILAGDHVKSAADLGIPMVAVGLLFRRGYFRQEVGMDGDQQHIHPELDLRRLPVRPVAGVTGGQLKVPIEFPDRIVHAAVWKLDVGANPLLLLDTDIPENDPADRPITHQLYVAGREMRFCQELILGVGSVRALEALGITPAAWHVNEGHAAMSLLERAARLTDTGLAMEDVRKHLSRSTLFTLHTPVPAGNEVFDRNLATKYLAPWAERLGTDLDGLMALAASHEGETNRFDLGALAIRFASIVNGVSERHGEIVRRDWEHLIDGEATSVTNGVHTPTWISRQLAAIVVRGLGSAWPTRLLENPHLIDLGDEVSDGTLWRAHTQRKDIFIRFAQGRLRRQMARHGASPDELRGVENLFPADRLTLGFARRFATYKRATLMFLDWDRLRSILTDADRPIQVVFAGKAHPADEQGQAFIRHIVEMSKSSDLRGHIHFLEDYDARIARFMVQGVDVWVNNPRPPMEASGTSGMKAAINGVPNLSVADGWWLEGHDEGNGWLFGSAEPDGDWGAADHRDAQSFYDVLQNHVAPLYYGRNEAGVPEDWVRIMRHSIRSTILDFSSHRMVAEYAERAYFPLATV